MELVEIVGIRFKSVGKIYYFDPCGMLLKKDDRVIVETVRGQEIGTVVKEVSQPETVSVVAEQVAAVTPSEVLETVNIEKHSIIVASTPNPDKAQLAISELSRKMQADYKVVQGDRRFRIAIESYSSEADANAALERIQATFSDAWVYIH